MEIGELCSSDFTRKIYISKAEHGRPRAKPMKGTPEKEATNVMRSQPGLVPCFF